MDNKTEQWFGATVSSSGKPEGPIVVSFNVCVVVYWHHWRTIDSSNLLYRITEAICPYLPRMTALFYHQTIIRYSGNVQHDIDGQRPPLIFFPENHVANSNNLPDRLYFEYLLTSLIPKLSRAFMMCLGVDCARVQMSYLNHLISKWNGFKNTIVTVIQGMTGHINCYLHNDCWPERLEDAPRRDHRSKISCRIFLNQPPTLNLMRFFMYLK